MSTPSASTHVVEPPGAGSRRRPDGSPSVVLAVTADKSLRLLNGFPRHLADLGWDVHVVSSPGPLSTKLAEEPGVVVHGLPMSREIALAPDLLALARWAAVLVRVRPDLVLLGTPKAGLLGGLTALVLRVPHRVFMLRGLRSEGTSGFRRRLVVLGERASAACAHHVLCVSESLRVAAVRASVLPPGRGTVLGAGSSNGVSVSAEPPTREERVRLRRTSFAAPEDFTLCYSGRVTHSKGLVALAQALSALAARGVAGNLLVVGGDDTASAPELRSALDRSGWAVTHVGQLDDPLAEMAKADVLCLPSLYREGLPNVVLEAAALGIPAIGSDATGMVDAIVDGVTGIIVPAGDEVALADAIEALRDDPARAERLGRSARQRVTEEFARPEVWARYTGFLLEVCASSPSRPR